MVSCYIKAMVDVDETFALSPSGKVVDHQKKITIAQVSKPY